MIPATLRELRLKLAKKYRTKEDIVSVLKNLDILVNEEALSGTAEAMWGVILQSITQEDPKWALKLASLVEDPPAEQLADPSPLGIHPGMGFYRPLSWGCGMTGCCVCDRCGCVVFDTAAHNCVGE
jgi:hypothetical protein